ncbi:MAG: HEAT repeat domain-containing protein [Candidatus Saccharibacteria bacterium]|nr:HEAT repeat domain-containing protein [Microbacteriaceae bacterium]
MDELGPPERRTAFGPKDPGNNLEGPTLPLPPPKSVEDLDRMLLAIATTPSENRRVVIDYLDGLEDKEAVAELLHRELFDLPSSDTSRTGLLLSVIGQLAVPSSVDVLEKFVWMEDDQLYQPESHPHEHPDDHHHDEEGADGSMFAGSPLQARAAEMLVWVGPERAWERTREILANHPSVAVRVATIDALSYSANDHPEALERLRTTVTSSDRWAVGMPRNSSESGEDFSKKFIAFQERLDEPPAPQKRTERGREDV